MGTEPRTLRALRGPVPWLALLVACRAVPPDAGFEEAAARVRERDGTEIVWRRGGAQEAELGLRVRGLLAQALSEDGAVELALLCNFRLQALFAELGFAQADLMQAARLPNPLLHAELRVPEGGGRGALDLGLEQSFLSLLWMPLRKRMAEDAFEIAKLRVATGALALAGEVRAAYRELQGMQQGLELTRTAFEAADAALELALRMHAAGNIRALDLTLQRAQREEARMRVADAELAVREQRELLAARIGFFRPDAELRVEAQLPELPADPEATEELEARAVANSLALESTRHEIERAARVLGLEGRMRLVPELELGVAAERESEGDWGLGPALSVPLPLFTQGQPRLRRAESELDRLLESYQADAIELRSQVRRTAERVLALHARAEFLRDVLIPLRGEVLDGLQLEVNAMQEGAFRLLMAKREVVTAGAEYVATLTDYWVARCELDGLLKGAPPGAATSSVRSTQSFSSDALTDPHAP